jgi:hypothetical protein
MERRKDARLSSSSVFFVFWSWVVRLFKGGRQGSYSSANSDVAATWRLSVQMVPRTQMTLNQATTEQCLVRATLITSKCWSFLRREN